jgi:fatty-acyl-CoA synthase
MTPRGVAGELLVQSRYMMQEYYRQPAETARALDADGWFHTGEMAILRGDGYVRFVGRYKDVLKIGGRTSIPLRSRAISCSMPIFSRRRWSAIPIPS